LPIKTYFAGKNYFCQSGFYRGKKPFFPPSGKNLPTLYRTLRGHKDRLQELIYKQFFSHRVVDSWNLLSSKIIEADTVDSFRRRLMRVVPSGEDDLSTNNQVSHWA